MRLQDLPEDYLESLRARIESKLETSYSGCLEWQAGKTMLGYGKVSVMGYTRLVPRIYYQLIKGFISDELVIDHLCRNPACANPDHLEPVTQKVNNLRGMGLTAQNARKTHCIHGHEFTPENTWIFPSSPTKRKCRQCELRLMSEHGKKQVLQNHKRGLTGKGAPLKRKTNSGC